MAGEKSTDGFIEYLRKIARLIGEAKIAPDADMPFLVDIETQVIGRLRAPADAASAAGMSAAPMGPPPGMGPGGPPMGPPMSGPPPGPMGPPPMAGAGARGLTTNPSMPGGDELRRLIGQ